MPETTVAFLLPDGCGGATQHGALIRIPGAFPGDVVRYSVAKKQGRTTLAKLEAILTPSPHRRPSPCPWSDRCGGCDLDTLSESARRAALAEFVQRAFNAPKPPQLITGAGQRMRITLALSGSRVGYREARSHQIVEPERCDVAHLALNRALATLRAWVGQHGSQGLSRCELRTDGERVVYALTSTGSVPRALREALGVLGHVALDGRRLAGDPTLTLRVRGLSLRVSPNSFFQAAQRANQLLVDHVLSQLEQLKPERVLDLYAGVGNCSLPIANELAPVTAVEREGQATADLTWNANTHGLINRVRVITRPVERLDPSRIAFDVAVLDPPRAGAPGVVAKLLHNRPRALVYVSCNPPTAARDLRPAFKAGYTLTQLTAFELFPRTRHVESVAVVVR